MRRGPGVQARHLAWAMSLGFLAPLTPASRAQAIEYSHSSAAYFSPAAWESALDSTSVLGRWRAEARQSAAQIDASSFEQDEGEDAAAFLPDAPSAQQTSEQRTSAQHNSAQTPQSGPPASGSSSSQPSRQSPGQNAPPSLEDLGLAPSQVKANPQEQARLDKRTHMLKVHQRLGLITAIPLAATVISSGGAKNGRNGAKGNTAGMDLHAALGGVSVGMYAATAYYAIAAPKIPGTQTRGAIRVHKALVWVHGPGMVLTPILGAMAFNQENNGEKVHGIASAHAVVAWTTVLAYGASMVSVSWPIKVKF